MKICIYWVPGHEGIAGNEKAGQLAKEAASRHPEENKETPPIVDVAFKAIIREWRDTNRKRRREDCSQAKELMGAEMKRNIARDIIDMERDKARGVVGILCGHTPLNANLHTIGVSESDMCSLYEVTRDDTTHVLCECSRTMEIRNRCLGSEIVRKEELREIGVDRMAKFLEEVNPWKGLNISGQTSGSRSIKPSQLGARQLH